jgi:hypothetical protein
MWASDSCALPRSTWLSSCSRQIRVVSRWETNLEQTARTDQTHAATERSPKIRFSLMGARFSSALLCFRNQHLTMSAKSQRDNTAYTVLFSVSFTPHGPHHPVNCIAAKASSRGAEVCGFAKRVLNTYARIDGSIDQGIQSP